MIYRIGVNNRQRRLGSQPQGSTPPNSASDSLGTPTTRQIILYAEEAKIQVADGVAHDAWTFNGTVTGPTIVVNQGDTVNFKLVNNMTTMAHSIDFIPLFVGG